MPADLFLGVEGGATRTTGVLADCMVFGHDPAGLLAGTYPRVTDPVRPAELVGCTVP